MPSFLVMGLSSNDPSFPLPPTFNKAELDVKVDEAMQSLKNAGYAAKAFSPNIKEGIELLKAELQSTEYDGILVGMGLRSVPPLTPYFEQIVETVRREAPNSKLAFNTSPETTLDAAKRAYPL